MHRFAPSLLVTAFLGTALCAPALALGGGGPPTPTTHYRWKDASGVVHFGDTIPSSALARGYDIVNGHGMVVRHVARELTPAQRRAVATAAARDAAARREAQRQQVEDSQMLAAYATDKDLKQSQQAQLRQIEDDIDTLTTNLRSQEDSLTELLTHAADLEHAGTPVPSGINRRIADQRETVNDERATMAQRRADLTRAKMKFEAQLDHYRALRAKLRNADDSAG